MPRFGGLVAIQAYNAYQDQYFLDYAVSVWQDYIPWMITPTDVARGFHPNKNGNVVGTCNGGEYCPCFSLRPRVLIIVPASNAGAIIDVRSPNFKRGSLTKLLLSEPETLVL